MNLHKIQSSAEQTSKLLIFVFHLNSLGNWICIGIMLYKNLVSCADLQYLFNPTALRMAKTLWSFGRSECDRVHVVYCVWKSNIRAICYVKASD